MFMAALFTVGKNKKQSLYLSNIMKPIYTIKHYSVFFLISRKKKQNSLLICATWTEINISF